MRRSFFCRSDMLWGLVPERILRFPLRRKAKVAIRVSRRGERRRSLRPRPSGGSARAEQYRGFGMVIGEGL